MTTNIWQLPSSAHPLTFSPFFTMKLAGPLQEWNESALAYPAIEVHISSETSFEISGKFQECEKTIEHGIILFHPLYFIPKMGLMHFLFYLHFKICSKQSRCSKVNGIACLQQFTISKLLELTNFALDHPVLYTYMNCDQRTWPLTHF